MRRTGGTPRRARPGQSGLTLVEALLAGAMMVAVLVAVTGVALSFSSRSAEVGDLMADHEAEREAIGRITIELRSAGPLASGAVLLRTGATDLVFASDNLPEGVGQWRSARYCWDGTDLVRQTSASIGVPSAACPDPSWGPPRPIARAVAGPVFGYSTAAGSTPTVTIALAAGAARPLESAVTVRNRGLGLGAVTCSTNGNNAVVGIGGGGGAATTIPVKLKDLPALKARLFGASPPPAGWQCP